MWYRADANMPRSPGILKLARLTGCSRREAIGLVHEVYSWATSVAQSDGTLPGVEGADITDALELHGEEGKAILSALLASGFLKRSQGGKYYLSNWYDIAGRAAEGRELDRKRKGVRAGGSSPPG